MILSNKLNKVLTLMGSCPIAEALLSNAISCSKQTPYNYLDITDKNDIISFVSSAKVEEVLSKTDRTWEIIFNSKFLSHSRQNNKIFKSLGYEIIGDRPIRPSIGTRGKVTTEYVSKTGKEYSLFEFNGNKIPLNKTYIKDVTDLSFFWIKNRNNIKVGRLVRALATHLDLNVNDKSIEAFVNKFKTIYDIEKNALNKFALVKGANISKWYKRENYIDGCQGQLINSCMKNSPSSYFNFYKDNDVKLLVLHTDNGKIYRGSYKSDKIKGRALVWENAKIGDIEVTFLDRIYTHNDSDIELFREYAKSKGWFWRDNNGRFTNGEMIISSNRLTFDLKKVKFRSYPYVDTLSYVDTSKKVAYSTPQSGYSMISLRRTNGSYN